MADVYVNSAAAGSNNGTSWTNAYTALGSALPGSAGDTVWVKNTHSESIGAATTYTPAAGVRVISTSSSAEPPTTYNTGAQIQTTGTNKLQIDAGSWFGLSLFAGNSVSSSVLNLGVTDNVSPDFEDCIFKLAGTGGSGVISVGNATSATVANCGIRTRKCNFQYTAAGQTLKCYGPWFDEGSNMDGGSTHPTVLFSAWCRAFVEFNGPDFSANANTYFGAGNGAYWARVSNAKLHASATLVGSLTVDNAGDIWFFDCNSGDVHYNLAHYNYRGNTVVSASIYANDGASYDGTNKHSFVVTGTNATLGAPYYSPWIDELADGQVGNAITPSFECARDGSATKYNDNQVWGEWMVKSTSGFPITTLVTDRLSPAGTAAAQATGSASWTGLSGTNCVMTLAAGSTVTPAEIGYMRGRIVVAGALTVYADPLIRGI